MLRFPLVGTHTVFCTDTENDFWIHGNAAVHCGGEDNHVYHTQINFKYAKLFLLSPLGPVRVRPIGLAAVKLICFCFAVPPMCFFI